MPNRREQLELLRKKKRFQELQQRKQAALPPGEAEVQAMLQSLDKLKGFVEGGASIASSAFAEPVSGAIGLLDAVSNLSAEKGAETVEDVKKQLTFRSEGGDEALQDVGGFLQGLSDIPGVDKLVEGAKSLSDLTKKAFEMTGGAIGGDKGRAILGSFGQAAPSAALELAGVKGLRAIDEIVGSTAKASKKFEKVKQLSSDVDKALEQAAPNSEQLKEVATGVYNQIDNLGVVIKPDSISSFATKAEEKLRKAGFDSQTDTLVNRALERINEIDGPIPTGEITILRKQAQKATDAPTKSESRLGRVLVNEFDDFLSNIKPDQTVKGHVKGLGNLYKKAGQLWKRSIKTNTVEDMFDRAKLKHAKDDVGFKNAIQGEFLKVINANKKTKQFSPEEISSMEKVVEGGKVGSMLGFIGRLDLTQQQKANMVFGVSTFGAGVAIGGPLGVAVPAVGFVSRKLADKLARGDADFAKAVVAAGDDGREIVRQYLKNVPKKQRDSTELTELLLNQGASLDDIRSNLALVEEAVGNAKNFSLEEFSLALGLSTPSELPQQEAQ